MRSSTETLVKALRILARDIQSDDGVANAAIAEAADQLAELERENAALKIKRNRLRVVLQDIADASGFDNIGNWARNKAQAALKETQP